MKLQSIQHEMSSFFEVFLSDSRLRFGNINARNSGNSSRLPFLRLDIGKLEKASRATYVCVRWAISTSFEGKLSLARREWETSIRRFSPSNWQKKEWRKRQHLRKSNSTLTKTVPRPPTKGSSSSSLPANMPILTIFSRWAAANNVKSYLERAPSPGGQLRLPKLAEKSFLRQFATI